MKQAEEALRAAELTAASEEVGRRAAVILEEVQQRVLSILREAVVS